jgi:hypothetical protein
MALQVTETIANEWNIRFTSDDATTATNVLTPATTQRIQVVDIAVTTESGTANLVTIGSRDSASSTITKRMGFYVSDGGPVPMNLQVPVQLPVGDILTVASSAATTIAVQLGGKYV